MQRANGIVLATSICLNALPCAAMEPLTQLERVGARSTEPLWFATAMALRPTGTILLSGQLGEHRPAVVAEFSGDGEFLDVFLEDVGFTHLRAAPDGRVFGRSSSGISVYSPDGELLSQWALSGEVRSFAVDAAGNVYIPDREGVTKYSTEGEVLQFFPSEYSEVVAIGPDGSVYIDCWCDEGFDPRMNRFAPDGSLEASWSIVSSGYDPFDAFFDSSGRLQVRGYDGCASYSPDGTTLATWSTEATNPWNAAGCDASGRLLVRSAWGDSLDVYAPVPTVVSAQPGNGTVRVDGISVSELTFFDWEPGSVHTLDVQPFQYPEPGVRYENPRWGDGSSISRTVIAGDAPGIYEALLDTSYALTMTADGAGSVTPLSGWYAAGSEITLNATAHPHHDFARWIGTGYSGLESSATFVLDEPDTQRARFLASGYDFTISASADDPYQNVAEATGGPRELYLWATCVERGLSAFEFGVGGTLTPLSFTGANGVLNLGSPTELLCAVPCLNENEVLLGSWLVVDDGGTLCARPSAANDWMVGVDCDVQRGNEPRVTGFSSDGTPVCVVGGDGCWDGPMAPAAPDGVIRDVAQGENARAGDAPAAHISPNPFSGSVEIRLSGFEPSTVRASIYDVTGRLVRTIATRTDAAAPMRWDGRDERGPISRAGVYFLRIDAPEHRETRKIVYLGP